jgi:hypothetical protein
MAGEVGEEVRVALQKGRKWSAWMLIWGCAGPAAVDCGGVEDAMREALQAFFQDLAVAATFAGSEGDRMALRVCISERVSARSVQRKTATIYLLYFLRSDLVLTSTIKVCGQRNCRWLPAGSCVYI